MYILKFVLFLASASLPLSLLANLNPGFPIKIDGTETGNSPVAVSGTNDGFMATWVSDSGNVWTSFSSDNGSSWSIPATVPYSYAITYSRIARGSLGTVVTFINTPPGGGAGTAFAAFSNNNGETWSRNIIYDPIGAYDIPICATDNGFIAAFPLLVDGSFYNAASSFSSDGTTWVSVQTLSSTHIAGTFSPTIAYNGSVYMAAWVNEDLTALFNISEDGRIWGDPNPIGSVSNVNSEITLTAVNNGILATWSDTSGNAYSSYTSNNGTTWSTPTPIAYDVNTTPYPTILASGSTSLGFIATWDGPENTAFASLSKDNGTTWSPEVQITPTGDYNDSFFLNFAGVSVVGSDYVITWIDSNNNIYANTLSYLQRDFSRPSNRR